ncbi:putative tubulin--tyrosine ligase pby1 [Microbotryomycetes sp. JL221]|nr:putative tubulin--tyrosine ligase pby1 [Microbotryomycetes sp. JL221]
MSHPAKRQKTVVSVYPQSQSYVQQSLERAFSHVREEFLFSATSGSSGSTSSTAATPKQADVEWSDYDEIDWDSLRPNKLVNSYVIRKGLIRKNHLAHTVALYLSKNPKSGLARAVPRTYFFNLSFPDELDELLMDDLYEVAQSFEANDNDDRGEGDRKTWWILKAALADKGNGIRLFSSRDTLEAIFEEFDIDSDDDDDDEAQDEADNEQNGYGDHTRVDATQMREWEYVAAPLLVDPSSSDNEGRKFHLRVYVVAAGGLRVHIHRPFLALFAPVAYEAPTETEDGRIDLASHLTNTCLQTSINGSSEHTKADLAVSAWPNLVGKAILSGPRKGDKLNEGDVKSVEDQVADSVSEVFKAAVGAGTSFQTLPNAFEIFGCDFLVDESMQVSLLEVNACPDFGQTGVELQNVIDHLFKETVDKVVVPFFGSDDAVAGGLSKLTMDNGGRDGLRQVLDMQVSRAW